MNFWVMQGMNGLAFGAVLFILASGFSLIFGLMRVANLAHGAYFMLGAYVGLAALDGGWSFWAAVLAGGVTVCILGGLVERLILRRLAGQPLAQVLVTLGIAFMIADGCLWIWSGDPRPVPMPEGFGGVFRLAGFVFPKYRVFVVVVAVALALALWLLLERTRIGAMIRAGVDDMEMARAMGIPTSLLFSAVFCLGSALAGAGGVLAGPILSVYPGLDADMLPLALVVVILGGVGSLAGAFLGSLVIGLIYSYGQALVPDLAYVVLFLPMVLVLTLRPTGLLGRRLA
ncbi:MAG: branched-chain amino acid ABC transporter permease [Methylobacterium sp.]